MSKTIKCAECGSEIKVNDGHNNCAAGYATRLTGEKVCYSCADASERAHMFQRKPMAAYLSGDGKTITTWTGGTLATVTASRPCKLSRPSWVHDRNGYRTLWATDAQGMHWIARGSPGICLTLRPVKT